MKMLHIHTVRILYRGTANIARKCPTLFLTQIAAKIDSGQQPATAGSCLKIRLYLAAFAVAWREKRAIEAVVVLF